MTDEPRLLGGRYRLGRLLGSGGMADVYDAMDERLARPVAVKVMKRGLAASGDAASRFASEARAAAKLSHPNAVAVFDTGEDEGLPWLVMERLPGRSLADVLRAGPVDQNRLRGWVLEALAALGAAHQAGFVHRDIKSANILLTEDGHAKVADFGIAKSIESVPGDIDLTSTGMLLGTPAYLAPERIEGAPATPQSDLFAMGVVIWEALVGHKPFDGPTPLAIAAKVQNAVVPPVGSLRRDADVRLAAAAEAAMAKAPADRPRTAEAMAAIITGAAPLPAPATVVVPIAAATVAMPIAPAQRTVAASTVRPVAGPPPRSGASGWAVAAGILAFLLLAGAGLLYLGRSSGNGPATGPTSTLPEVTTSLATTSTTVRSTSTTLSANQKLAASLRSEADRVAARGESASDEVAGRLQSIADLVESGSSRAGPEATKLRNDLPGLVADGNLTSATAKEVDAALSKVPGVGPAPTTTTAAPTTTSSTSTTTTLLPGGKGGKGG